MMLNYQSVFGDLSCKYCEMYYFCGKYVVRQFDRVGNDAFNLLGCVHSDGDGKFSVSVAG